MLKSRRRIAEEEAKKDIDYIPTKNLHAEGEEENKKVSFPLTPIIVMGIIVALIVVCIVVMFSLGGPVNA